MRNKGFTLVEMLAVIALLAIIGTITAVSVKNIKKNQDEENKLNVISAIFTGARNYITENSISIAKENNQEIEISYLKEKSYVDFDEEKYNIFKGKTVEPKLCDNNLKYEIIYVYRKEYRKKDRSDYVDYHLTDCGCAEQSSKENSFKLCEAGTDGKAGWDVNGIYYNENGKPVEDKNLNFDN